MKNKQIPEISFLLNKVCKVLGREIHSTNDFELLSSDIEDSIGEYLSVSTLKRLWGYVSMTPTPRISTLDILARYVGEKSFSEYCKGLRIDPSFESGFFTSYIVESEDLKEGDTITLAWSPNRIVSIEHIGNCEFKVTRSENSLLKKDDEFKVSQFMLGHPLFIDRIRRNGTYTPSYVAGKIDGLSLINLQVADN